MKTLIINKTKNRSLVIDKTMLKKSISLYNGKTFVRKHITKTCLYSKLGVYVRTKSLGKSILIKYMLQKLGQYFTIKEILKPIIYDLKTSPLLYGFRIIFAGRIIRKERAAILIKSMENLPLNKKVAKIQKFGMVGIKIFFCKKNKRISFYPYSVKNNTINFALILIVSGLLEDTVKKVAKPSWYLMLRKTKAISYKKAPNPEYDNLKAQPDEIIIEEKLATMLNADGTLKDTFYDPSKPLPRLSVTDNSGCNHMLVCKNIESITRKAEYLVIGNLTSSGVAYILNKNGVEVGVRHIGELVHIYSPNNEQRMQYFWAFQTPMIASAKDLYKLKKESQTLAEYPHIRSHFNSHYTHWRKRGILSEYKNSNSDKDKEIKRNNTNSGKRNNIEENRDSHTDIDD